MYLSLARILYDISAFWWKRNKRIRERIKDGTRNVSYIRKYQSNPCEIKWRKKQLRAIGFIINIYKRYKIKLGKKPIMLIINIYTYNLNSLVCDNRLFMLRCFCLSWMVNLILERRIIYNVRIIKHSVRILKNQNIDTIKISK